MKKRYLATYDQDRQKYGVYDMWCLHWISFHRTAYMADRQANHLNTTWFDAVRWATQGEADE